MKKDIVIIGGGPTGLSLACLLADSGLDIVVIEKSSEESLKNPAYDGREIALTHPSKDLLTDIGVWGLIEQNGISKIEHAKVLNGHSSYSLDFDADKSKVDALGYLVSNNLIRKALFERVSKISNVEIINEVLVEDVDDKNVEECMKVILSDDRVIEASLVVAADSRFSKSRGRMGISADMRDFAKTMIVCKMDHEKSHENIAWECFYDERVLAILPMSGNTSSVVVTVDAKKAQEMVDWSEEEFNDDITSYFEDRLGKMKLAGKRYSYPLIGVYANDFVSQRFVLAGDACVGMHPVTAHGFNLGLVGNNILVGEIKKALKQEKDIGSSEFLNNYQTKHKKETKLMYYGTNSIVSLFTNNHPMAKTLRDLLLKTANSKLLPFKSIISNRLTGKKKSSKTISILRKLCRT
jgi:ubiquinone biosynthesis UbiH/UbiF/VisC/COQ6 family hydroxylase